MNINTTDEIAVHISTGSLYSTRDITEAEFRALLGATLIALGTSGELPFEASRAMETAGMFLAEEDPIGDPDMDFSALGTFLTAPQIVGTIDDAIAGTDIPGYQEHLLATENDPR